MRGEKDTTRPKPPELFAQSPFAPLLFTPRSFAGLIYTFSMRL
jgi:hypothetical protein